jgi:hypothetical protein
MLSEIQLGPQATAAVLGALVGGVIALVSGFLVQFFILWRQRIYLRQNLLIALDAEIDALLSVLKLAWGFRQKAQDINITGSYWMLPRTTLDAAHMGVFSQAAADIGVMPSAIVRPVFSFYGQLLALQQFVASQGESISTRSSELQVLIIKEIGQRYFDTAAAGDEALRELRRFCIGAELRTATS